MGKPQAGGERRCVGSEGVADSPVCGFRLRLAAEPIQQVGVENRFQDEHAQLHQRVKEGEGHGTGAVIDDI